MAVNGFAAAFECGGKLGSSLFACGIGVPQFLRIKSFATFKLSAAGMAFIALFAVSATVLFDLFWAAEKAFFVFKGFDSV